MTSGNNAFISSGTVSPLSPSSLPLSWRSSCKKPSPRHWTHILYTAQDRSQRDDGSKENMKWSEGERVLERGVCEIEANEAAWWDERIRSHYAERMKENGEITRRAQGRNIQRTEGKWMMEGKFTNTLPASLKPGDLQIPQKEECCSTRSHHIFTPYFKSHDGLITIIGSSHKHRFCRTSLSAVDSQHLK